MKKTLKITAIILALLMAFSSNVFAANAVSLIDPQEASTSSFGDVSGDGKVSILDSAYVFFHIIGLRKLNEETLANADVNGDGEITFADMSEITQYSFNMIPVFSADTFCWIIGQGSYGGNVFNGGSSEGGDYTQEKDENGNNIYLLNEFYKNAGITADSPIAMKGVNIECNGNPDENQIMEVSFGIDSDRIYADAQIKQWGSVKSVANMLRFRMISDNGKATLVLPSINSYVTDLGDDFIDIDEFTSIGEIDFNSESELDYMKTYYSHSLYVVRGGVKYICEIYREPFYLQQYYFTPDGKLARTETIRIANTDRYSITECEYFGTEFDESMFDIPAYYIEISLEDLKKFISSNSLAQAFFEK